MNLRSFRDLLVRVSILVRKRLDFRHVLEVHFDRKVFTYLDIWERTINLYSTLSSYWNTLILNFRLFGDPLVLVSILLRKWLDLRHVLEVHFGRKGIGYLDIRKRPIYSYSVLSSYWNTSYCISGQSEIVWYGFQYWYVKG